MEDSQRKAKFQIVPEDGQDPHSPDFDPKHYRGRLVSDEDRKVVYDKITQRGNERLEDHKRQHPHIYKTDELDCDSWKERPTLKPREKDPDDLVKALLYPYEPDLQEAGKNNEYIYQRLTPFQQNKVEAQILYKKLGFKPSSNTNIGLLSDADYDRYPISAMCSAEYRYLAERLVAEHQRSRRLEQQKRSAKTFAQYVANEAPNHNESKAEADENFQPGKLEYLRKPFSKYHIEGDGPSTPKDSKARRSPASATFSEPRRSSRLAHFQVEDLYSLDGHKKGVVERKASQEVERHEERAPNPSFQTSKQRDKTSPITRGQISAAKSHKGQTAKTCRAKGKRAARLPLVVVLKLSPAALSSFERINPPKPRSPSPPGVFDQEVREDGRLTIWPHLERPLPKKWEGKGPYTTHDMAMAEEANLHRLNEERLRAGMAYFVELERAERGVPSLPSRTRRARKDTPLAPANYTTVEVPADPTENTVPLHKDRPNPDYNNQRRLSILQRNFEAQESLRSHGLIPRGSGPPPVDVTPVMGRRDICEDMFTHYFGANTFMSRSHTLVRPIEEFRRPSLPSYKSGTLQEQAEANSESASEDSSDPMELDDR